MEELLIAEGVGKNVDEVIIDDCNKFVFDTHAFQRIYRGRCVMETQYCYIMSIKPEKDKDGLYGIELTYYDYMYPDKPIICHELWTSDQNERDILFAKIKERMNFNPAFEGRI